VQFRSFLFVAACAVTSLAATVTAASAQSASPMPVASPTSSAKPAVAPSTMPAASPSPTATPYKLITFTGSSVDAGITTILGSDKARFKNGNPARVFDGGNGPFQDYDSPRIIAPANDFVNVPVLQDAIVNFNVNGPFIGGRIEYAFGTDFDAAASNGQSHSGNGPLQAYLQAVKGPFTLLVGKFSTLAGAEVIEAPGNTNYSRSYQFGNAVPFTHAGVRLTYAYSPKLSVIVGANNGWDDWKFVGKKKTLEGGLIVNPSPGYSLNLSTYNGSDFAQFGQLGLPAGPGVGILTNRMLYDGVLTVHPTSALTLVGNYDNGTQLADGTGYFATAHWNAIEGIATYQFTPLYALSLRKESFHDVNGFRSGYVQRVQSSTATINFTPGANYIVRAEYRLDGTDGDNYTFRNDLDNIGRSHQPSFGLEGIVKFP